MASKAQIQAVKADFFDPALYDDPGVHGLPQLSRGCLLTAVSRAFDLAEGRRPGHAQRVAYVGTALAAEVGLRRTCSSPRSFMMSAWRRWRRRASPKAG
jgi:hypothetical protein